MNETERDAARYRWLREHWEEISGQSFRGTHPPGKGGYLLHKSDPAAVDEAIDAAMTGTETDADRALLASGEIPEHLAKPPR